MRNEKFTLLFKMSGAFLHRFDLPSMSDTFVIEINLQRSSQWNASAWMAEREAKVFYANGTRKLWGEEVWKCFDTTSLGTITEFLCDMLAYTRGSWWKYWSLRHDKFEESSSFNSPTLIIERLLLMSSIKWKRENKKQFPPRAEINGFKWRRSLTKCT